MRVHLIRKETIESFVAGNSRSRPSFSIWLTTLKYANWSKPIDIMQTFRSADLLGRSSNRVVFDIGGNNYRMICKCVFGEKQIHLFICWIGTHADYNRICKNGKQYTISEY